MATLICALLTIPSHNSEQRFQHELQTLHAETKNTQELIHLLQVLDSEKTVAHLTTIQKHAEAILQSHNSTEIEFIQNLQQLIASTQTKTQDSTLSTNTNKLTQQLNRHIAELLGSKKNKEINLNKQQKQTSILLFLTGFGLLLIGLESFFIRQPKNNTRNIELNKLRNELAFARSNAGLLEALNDVNPQNGMRQALYILNENMNASICAIFEEDDEGITCIAANKESWEADQLNQKQIKIIRDTIHGTGSQHISSERIAQRDLVKDICPNETPGSIRTWPILYKEQCIGALMIKTNAILNQLQLSYITTILKQFSLRLYSLQLEHEHSSLVQELHQSSCNLHEVNEQILLEQKKTEEQARFKAQFLAMMSHELRTPLNAINGFSKRLMRKLVNSLEDRDKRALEAINRNGHFLLNMINDILDYSKIEAGKMTLSTNQCDIAEMCQHLAEDCRSLAQEKKLTLHIECPDSLQLDADPLKLQQIMNNLISNAIKYTEKGRVKISCKQVEDETIGPAACLSVNDSGIGIPNEYLPTLFDQFTQVPHGTQQGTGLGLAITKRFIDLHGGRISVESALGIGSTFTVLLPIIRKSLQAENQASEVMRMIPDEPLKNNNEKTSILSQEESSRLTKATLIVKSEDHTGRSSNEPQSILSNSTFEPSLVHCLHCPGLFYSPGCCETPPAGVKRVNTIPQAVARILTNPALKKLCLKNVPKHNELVQRIQKSDPLQQLESLYLDQKAPLHSQSVLAWTKSEQLSDFLRAHAIHEIFCADELAALLPNFIKRSKNAHWRLTKNTWPKSVNDIGSATIVLDPLESVPRIQNIIYACLPTELPRLLPLDSRA